MASLIIDTSSWIELAKPRFNNLLAELEKQVDSGLLSILMNDIIIDEWHRNRKRITKSIIDSIKQHAKSASKIAEFLKEEEAKSLLEIVKKYREHEELQVAIANDHIARVERLMLSGVKLGNPDHLKIEIADRALMKRAPFHNSKNNVADALIIFCAIQYVRKEKVIQNSLIFVSGNYKEFCAPNNIKEVHPEILEDAEEVNLVFTNNIGRVLDVKEEKIEDEETYAESQFWSWVATEAEIARGK